MTLDLILTCVANNVSLLNYLANKTLLSLKIIIHHPKGIRDTFHKNLKYPELKLSMGQTTIQIQNNSTVKLLHGRASGIELKLLDQNISIFLSVCTSTCKAIAVDRVYDRVKYSLFTKCYKVKFEI